MPRSTDRPQENKETSIWAPQSTGTFSDALLDQGSRDSEWRLFLHFFDIHFLEDKTPRGQTEGHASELRAATRLAIAAADRVIVPAASYVESPLCRQILDEHAELYAFGIIDIAGNAPNFQSFADQKLSTYRPSSRQAEAYTSLNPLEVQPPFHKRLRGATSDLKEHWKGRVDQGNLISFLGQGTGYKFPINFEEEWSRVPDRLESQAFVVEHIEEHLGETARHSMIRHRLHSIINEGYFGSYTRDFNAGIVSDLVYFQASYQIPSNGRDLPYKHLINHLRRSGLLAHTQACNPMQLLELRQDPRWIECLRRSLRHILRDVGAIWHIRKSKINRSFAVSSSTAMTRN